MRKSRNLGNLYDELRKLAARKTHAAEVDARDLARLAEEYGSDNVEWTLRVILDDVAAGAQQAN